MSDILQDLSAPALVAAIEANLFALFPLFRRWPRAEVHDGPDMLWCITDIPFPVFNSILRVQIRSEDVEPAIQAAMALGKSKNVPVLWWTGPATRPTDLGDSLTAHGFVHAGDVVGMAADLLSLREDLPAPPGLVIEPITAIDYVQEWCRTCTAGFGMPAFVADALFDFLSHLVQNQGT